MDSKIERLDAVYVIGPSVQCLPGVDDQERNRRKLS